MVGHVPTLIDSFGVLYILLFESLPLITKPAKANLFVLF